MGSFDLNAHNERQALLLCAHCGKHGHTEDRCFGTLKERGAAKKAANLAAWQANRIARGLPPNETKMERIQRTHKPGFIGAVVVCIREQLKVRGRTLKQLTNAVCTYYKMVSLQSVQVIVKDMKSKDEVYVSGIIKTGARGRVPQVWSLRVSSS